MGTNLQKTRLLVIRMSSFGDIAQTLAAIHSYRSHFGPDAEIHWVVRSDFKDFLELFPAITHIHPVYRKDGLKGLFRLAETLNQIRWMHIYDAHNNLRSHILCALLKKGRARFFRRPKHRWKRFLLFRLGIKSFQMPFIAAHSFHDPLRLLGVPFEHQPAKLHVPLHVQDQTQELLGDLKNKDYCLIAPTTAWAKKSWPLSSWKEVIAAINFPIILTGGPNDDLSSLTADLSPSDQSRVLNLAGKTRYSELVQLIHKAKVLVSADTGALHVADLIGTPALALIGPTAFGFPSRKTSEVLEVDLPCRPCTKDGSGGCKNSVYQRCMKEITPKVVIARLKRFWSTKTERTAEE